MGLIDAINSLFGRRSAAIVTTADSQTAASSGAGRATQLIERLTSDMERAQTIRTCRLMYKTDPRAKGAIKTVARDAIKGGFRVVVKNNPRAETESNDLVKRLGLTAALDDWVRLTLRDGDSFIEIGVANDRRIGVATRKPTLQMHRASNGADRFDDPARAYWQGSEMWVGQEPPEDAIWYADWQVIHARWDHDEGSRYGESLFASATGAWKRMKEGEVDISVRRKTRSGMRYIHSLEGAGEADIEAYKEKNKDALNNPFAAISDFFVNKKATISAVQGDAHLAEIGDVMHHIRTWFVASPVPMSLVGYGQDLNRDVLEEQQTQYNRAIEQITEWVEAEFVRPLLERQWLLLGILPEGLDYELEWMSKDPLTAKDISDVADAVLRLQAAGVDGETINSLIRRFLPGVQLGGENDAARMAGHADKLRDQVEA